MEDGYWVCDVCQEDTCSCPKNDDDGHVNAHQLTVPSRQEMFDRAVRGLASQEWKLSFNDKGCVYHDTVTGRRCAWGWVDEAIPSHAMGDVISLRRRGIGIAASIQDDDMKFAMGLQQAHDRSVGVVGVGPRADSQVRDRIIGNMRELAERYLLVWPSDLSVEEPKSVPDATQEH